MRFTSHREVCNFAFLFFLIFATWQQCAMAQGPLRPYGPSAPQQPEQAPPPPPAAPPSQEPGYAITVTVPVVNVDVVVTDNDGGYLPDLKKENFRITEEGAPQIITNFSTGDAPITVAILVEYSRLGYGWYLYNAQSWADVFLRQLKPVDWIALMSFNMRINVDVDFTHSASEVQRGLISLQFPPFSESNIFDALTETVDRMQDVKGKKAILVLASGIDTFSRLTLDKTIAKLRGSDVTIFCVGVGEQFALALETSGGLGSTNLTYLQAQNQLKNFAAMTGGRAWFPRFDGEIRSIMSDVAASLRYQYSLAYTPTNQTTDGKYRKIKVELVDANGKPLVVTDQKGKRIRYQVYARQGYFAPKSNVVN